MSFFRWQLKKKINNSKNTYVHLFTKKKNTINSKHNSTITTIPVDWPHDDVLSVLESKTKWFLCCNSDNYEELVKLAIKSSILFRKFLPSILSQRTSLKGPPRFSHFLSFTSWPLKKSLRGEWAILTWTFPWGSHLIAINLLNEKRLFISYTFSTLIS